MNNFTFQKIHDSTITNLVQSNSGNFVITSAVDDYNVRLSSIKDDETQQITVLESIPIETVFRIKDVIFDKENNSHFYCCYQRTIQQLDIERKALIHSVNSIDRVNCISENQKILYAGCSTEIDVFDFRMQGHNPALSLPTDENSGESVCILSETGYLSHRYNLISGTSHGLANFYDFRNEQRLQFDLGYIFGENLLSVDQILMNQNKFNAPEDPGLFIMTNEPKCTRILQLDMETAGQEIVHEYRRMDSESHERYQTQFVTVGKNHDILVGSGSNDGRVLLLSGRTGHIKREHTVNKNTNSMKKSVINHISYRQDIDKGVLADSNGYVYRFNSGMLSDASI